MKKSTKWLAVMLAAAMVVSLAACSGDQDKESDSSASQVVSGGGENSGGTQRSADAQDATTANVDDDAQTLDFEKDTFTPWEVGKTSTLSENIIWGTDKDNHLIAVTKEGKVIYQASAGAEPVTSFYDGAALVRYRGTSNHDDIIDKEGNTLYSTKRDDSVEEEILTAGDGAYLMKITESSMDGVITTFGFIDKTGNKINDFLNAADYADGDHNLQCDEARYLGDSVFLIDDRWLCDVQGNQVTNAYTIPCDKTNYDIRFIAADDGGIFEHAKGWVDLYTGMKTYPAVLDAKNLTLTVYEVSDEYAIKGRTLVDGSECYDLEGNKIVVDVDTDQPITVNGFSEDGYASVEIEGVGGKEYLTFVDQNGKKQFEPIPIESEWFVSGNVSDKYFGTINTERGGRYDVCDHTGTPVYQMTIAPTDTEKVDLRNDYVTYRDHLYWLEDYKG